MIKIFRNTQSPIVSIVGKRQIDPEILQKVIDYSPFALLGAAYTLNPTNYFPPYIEIPFGVALAFIQRSNIEDWARTNIKSFRNYTIERILEHFHKSITMEQHPIINLSRIDSTDGKVKQLEKFISCFQWLEKLDYLLSAGLKTDSLDPINKSIQLSHSIYRLLNESVSRALSDAEKFHQKIKPETPVDMSILLKKLSSKKLVVNLTPEESAQYDYMNFGNYLTNLQSIKQKLETLMQVFKNGDWEPYVKLLKEAEQENIENN